ncbi:hypothetical protein B0O80DRAFT_121586 [Mortierella sp. GBAus27b]|nr:hypothetical protein B0O80DRAFT_121586 [Mortierella sp. GBAus27b]
MSAVRLVSSAKNLREQFKSPTSSSITMGSNNTHNGSISRSQTLGPPANGSSLSRRGTLLRTSSSGNLNRTKSIPKKSIISKVFADEESKEQETLPDLSMDMTYLIVKRCVKEIRERGLATKGILRQVQMAPNQKVIMNTIRTILDDDASTELSPLRQIDIHLVAHSMKWAIRYSEEILVTHDDYRALYINQDRDFVRFAHSLPPTNRATLLELFSLCADVTLLAHLNNMTLVSVAKAISLSIMAGPEREFTTFDASLQQRNIWGAACEDLLRAFLRIKTSYDLAKIDQEDEVDENRYICTETRQLKNAREQSSMMRLDISTPSSTSSTGWPTPSGIVTSASCSNATGYFDMVPQPSGSSPAHAGGSFGASLSRTPSLAKSNRPISMAINMNDFEELMHDQSRREPQPDRNSLLRPADQTLRRRSSVTDMDSLYMLPAEATTGLDGYESDPEVNHAIEDEEDSQDALIPDFADGLGWDFSKAIDLTSSDMLSLDTFKPESDKDKAGVNRSNSASSNTSGIGPSGPPQTASPRTIRDLSKQQLVEMRLQTQVQQAPSMDEIKSPTSPLQRMGSINRPRMGHVRQNSSTSRTRRHSSRRSISINSGRLHMKPGGLQADLLAHELALKTEKDMVARDIRQRLRGIKESDSQEPAAAVNPGFSLQLSPPDLERPSALGPRRSHLSLKDRPKTMLELNFDLPVLTAEPLSTMINEPVSTAVAKEPEDNDDTRAFEVVSRPRYTESAPLVSSPKEEQKFKLPESTPERAATPPEARRTPPFGRPKRSATDSSSRSGTKTPPTPDKNRAPLQQTVAHSTGSITSSPGESKSKTPGFIRALSSKLRSKQNEDQPKPVRINNQVVGTPAVPSVPLELPRLELSFMGDSLRPSQLVPSPDSLEVHQLPALAVPSSNENLRRASLPNTDNSKGRQDLQPTGFAAVRRASAAVFGSGNHSVREQNQKTKQGADAATTSAAASEVLKTRNGDDSGPKASKAVLPKEQASVPQELPREYSFPKKEAASEREIQFSTALLLKDGKLHYQVLWDDECSDLGFESDMFEPEQTLSGIHHHPLGLSRTNPRKQHTESAATATLQRKRSTNNSQNMALMTAADSCSQSLDRPGQRLPLGQATRDRSMTNSTTTSMKQNQGPSPAQRAAADRRAQESFKTLTSNPTTLTELMEMCASRTGPPVIINSGSFVRGSEHPQMNQLSQFPATTLTTATTMTKTTTINRKTISRQKSMRELLPSPDVSPNNSSRFNLLEISLDGDEPGNARRTMFDISSPISPAEATRSKSLLSMKQPGSAAVGGGGAGSFVSSSPGQRRQHKRTDSSLSVTKTGGTVTEVNKSKRFFGKKVTKLTKKSGLIAALSGGSSKKKSLPLGERQQDAMTKTVESMDEVFPWMCIEHTAGAESEWVELAPVQNGAVGWVVVDKLGH